MSAASPWQRIPAREIAVGDVVSVVGIQQRRSVIIHVSEVDRTHEREVLVVEGRQPWGGSWRHVFRHVHPEAVVDRLIDPGPLYGKAPS